MGPNTLLTSPLFHVHLNHRDDKPPLRMELFTAPVHVREWPTGMVSQLEWLHSVAPSRHGSPMATDRRSHYLPGHGVTR